MRTKFYNEVLLPLIEQAKTSVYSCDLLNDSWGFDETPDQQSQKIVLEQLLTLKEHYETLTDQEIQQRFEEIIRKNPPTKRPKHRKSIFAKWSEVYRRNRDNRRSRKGGKDQKHD